MNMDMNALILIGIVVIVYLATAWTSHTQLSNEGFEQREQKLEQGEQKLDTGEMVIQPVGMLAPKVAQYGRRELAVHPSDIPTAQAFPSLYSMLVYPHNGMSANPEPRPGSCPRIHETGVPRGEY